MYRALIIENEDIANILAYVLREDGYDVVTIRSIDNVNEITDFKPDIVIVHERNNGKLAGHAVIRSLKNDDQTKTVKAVLTSTHYSIKEIADACEADGFIRKPFEITEVLSLINGLFKR